ncbi:hypothetical protein T4B_7975 [Trichinella pseudospiralis]|uniref:Uncharacterized protein n=1 Tax=Trichinella pseudospiralis TaxID=6337 RepID=A0A0V1K3G4_TRIPS|nr:hypothetical protein T4B_7975 [Trichinella pseudospiralis]KRZ41770.1 hypothetical protein T4C_8918 [Trichinella pseudospiralis]
MIDNEKPRVRETAIYICQRNNYNTWFHYKFKKEIAANEQFKRSNREPFPPSRLQLCFPSLGWSGSFDIFVAIALCASKEGLS